MKQPATVPCQWCGKPTQMTATRLCDEHWELERRIAAAPLLARRMLPRRRINPDFLGGMFAGMVAVCLFVVLLEALP